MVRHGAESAGGPDFPVGQTTGFRSRRDGAARFRPGKNSAGCEQASDRFSTERPADPSPER